MTTSVKVPTRSTKSCQDMGVIVASATLRL
jgi:hypothetical protein